MAATLGEAFWRNFLGQAPDWYKGLIVGCLVANPVLFAIAGPVVTSWVVLFEFIATLMMALRCYPLQPGGLIAIEATLLGLVTPAGIQQEIVTGLPVILLLMFMVAGIFFLREMLVYTFTKMLLRIHSRMLIAFLFCAIGALLSAFLDALTVLAVMITVAGGSCSRDSASASDGSAWAAATFGGMTSGSDGVPMTRRAASRHNLARVRVPTPSTVG
jgi:NhaB family Na+:H+ antiporter